MNPRKITPDEAIELSIMVYRLQKSADIEAAFKGSTMLRDFDFCTPGPLGNGASVRFAARSGVLEFKTKTGFAILAMGKPDGRHSGEAVLICRGTDSAYDWLTDANYAITLGPSGSRVHSGFHRTFSDMKEGFARYLDQNAPRKVHCVGHSLGGALVSLAADWLSSRGYAVELYTFGSPRVGLADFATNLTGRLGRGRIHRACHSSDPVSMVPVWPYLHAPNPDGECWMNYSSGFSIAAHKSATYAATVKGQSSWSELECPTPTLLLENSVRLWTTESLVGVIIAAPLMAFNAILGMLLGGAAIAFQPGLSLLDQTAMYMEKLVNNPIDTENPALMFLHALAKVVGIVVRHEQQVAHEQIKQLFRAFLWIRHREALRAAALPN